jgi:hypothetical protein
MGAYLVWGNLAQLVTANYGIFAAPIGGNAPLQG